jgi:hypothetical protein
MTPPELNAVKLNLVDWINQLSDKHVLTFLEALRLSNNKGEDWWKDLSDAQKKQIKLGIKDADEGNFLTSEEFWKRIKKA